MLVSKKPLSNTVLLSPLLSPSYLWGNHNKQMYFYLKEPNTDSETLIYLYYYVKSEGKNFKYSTGKKIHPDQWDSENRFPKTLRGSRGTENKHLSTYLQKFVNLIDEILKDADLREVTITRQYLRKKFDVRFKNTKQQTHYTLPEMVQLFIDSKNKTHGQSDAWNQKYTNLKNKLEYFEDDHGTITKIDNDFIDQYAGYLRTINRKPFKPHNDNTLHRNINFLFTFLYWANGKYLKFDSDEIKNPVKRYQADDVHLTDQEIQKIIDVKLSSEALIRARDLFLIGVYSGQRFSDYSVFEKADVQGNLIIKRAEKTENESFIPLHDNLRALLEKYEWKLPTISGQKFNVNIQKVCKKAKINEEFKETIYRGNKKKVNYYQKWEVVTSHTARRTFITLAAEKGMPDHIIMKITGIRDIKTLQKYKKTSQRSVSEAMDRFMNEMSK